jgi:hypothetical protein
MERVWIPWAGADTSVVELILNFVRRNNVVPGQMVMKIRFGITGIGVVATGVPGSPAIEVVIPDTSNVLINSTTASLMGQR